MKKKQNKISSQKEFKSWPKKEGLIMEEKYIFEKYLNDKNYKILEAGCGGGRIIYELKKMGYINLSGFDVVKNLINAAEKKQESEKIINFSLQNAVNLNYPNNNFDFLIYLQQIICFIENKKDRQSAIQEAYRILKPGGMACFSFLNFKGRKYNYPLALIIFFLRLLAGEKNIFSKFKLLPWLKKDNNFNWGFWKKNEDLNYWFNKQEAVFLLRNNGFEIKDVFTQKTIRRKFNNCLLQQGMLYIIAQK